MLGSILFFLSDKRGGKKTPILSEIMLIGKCKTVSVKCENQSSAFTAAEFCIALLSCISLSLCMHGM